MSQRNIDVNIPLRQLEKNYREPYKNPYGREGVVGGTVGSSTYSTV